jgi:hypothetical protein
MAGMTDAALPRPRQVTLAGWLIMAGSLLVVVTVFERLAGLNSLETRTAVERFLAEPPGEGSGLDTETVLTAIRVLAMVAGGCAAAAAILGFHVLKGSRGARIGVTVLAGPLFVSGMVAGGFLSSLVAAAAVLLWLEPARDWFAGRPAREAPREEPPRGETAQWRPEPTPPPGPPTPTPPTTTPPPAGTTSAGPGPTHGFGSVPTGPAPYASSWPAPPGTSAGTGAPPAGRRPDAVVWACVLTWVFSGLAALFMGLGALVLAASPDLVFDELRRQNPELLEQGLTEGAITTATYVSAAVVIVWSAVASVLAVLVVRRVRWARTALLVVVGLTGAVCLATSFQSLLMVLPLLASVAAFSLLLRPEVRHWITAP